jgi:DNA (cytosine-5)-methyltransferase 1
LKYLSVCSGIEAATVAWAPLGWKPVAFSEVDKAACRLLKHHYPDVPNWGDMTKFKEWPDAAVDVLVGGTPCQSFSVAGLRQGMDDPRGNLALTYLAIADRYKPTYIVWENVPGVLSSNGGRDFGSIIGGMGEIGYSVAYRVLDAQYFGLVQRRERVFVVGYLGDWRPPAAVLFERESLLGHPAPRREARKDVARPLTAGSPSGSGYRNDADTADNLIVASDVAPTLTANGNKTGGDRPPGTDGDSVLSLIVMSSGQANAEIREDGGATTLTCLHEAPIVAFKASHFTRGKDGAPTRCSICPPTLRAGGHHKSHANGGVAPAIAFSIMPMNSGKDYKARETDVAQPFMAGGPVGGNQGGDFIVEPVAGRRAASGGSTRDMIATTSVVRRLTPTECERLQGFPEIHRKVTIWICGSEEEKRALASSAELHSAAQKRALSEPAAAHVLIDCERSAVQIRKAGKLIWSASGAEPSSACPLSMPLADFVRLAVLMTTTAVPQIQAGKAASPPSINGSLPQWTGSALVPVSGRATGDLASDVARLAAAATTSTTSQHGRHSQQSASTLEILSCCVVAAIASCIREKIQPGNSFSVSVETRAGYTQVPVGNKPTADGPRYKQLGNSMAVPVMAWIGERIQMVEDLINE